MLKHVVQPVEQDVAALQVVPEQQQVADRRRGEGHERVERHQAADRQVAAEHLVRPGPQEEPEAEKRHGFDGALVAHGREVGLEDLLRHAKELIEQQASKRRFAAEGLDRFDPLDGIDLVRVVLAVRSPRDRGTPAAASAPP